MGLQLIKQNVYSEHDLNKINKLNESIIERRKELISKMEFTDENDPRYKKAKKALERKINKLNKEGILEIKKYFQKRSFTINEIKKRYNILKKNDFSIDYLSLEETDFKLPKLFRDIYTNIHSLNFEKEHLLDIEYKDIEYKISNTEMKKYIQKNIEITINRTNDYMSFDFNDYDEFSSFFTSQDSTPKKIDINIFSDVCIYMYKNNLFFYDEFDIHTDEQKELLVKKYYFSHLKKFTNLEKEISLLEKLDSHRHKPIIREQIPEEVKFFVWRRDEGKCVSCGSNENLEFDHIIPFSKGGSNSERNLQLLCQTCNRKKSNKI